jgi:hypothetical protein
MKIITSQTSHDTIDVSKINGRDHIVVAVIHNKPTILGKGYNQDQSDLIFFLLGTSHNDQCITKGNGYDYSDKYDTIEKMVLRAIDDGHKVEAFRNEDWKQALQWLINNTY